MKHIFFDIDDTLIQHTNAERAAIKKFYSAYSSQLHGNNDDQFVEKWVEISKKHFKRFLNHEITFQNQRRERIFEVFKESITDDQADSMFDNYLTYYEENWALFEDAMECLESLKNKYRLGILSNGNPKQQRQKLVQLKIDEFFSPVIISGDIQKAKPNSAIFNFAKSKATSSARFIYIGDCLETDIISARDAGWIGVWLNRNGEIFSPAKKNFQISALKELPELIERLEE